MAAQAGAMATTGRRPSLWRLARWLGRYSLRRWPGMTGLLLIMLARTGLELLRPWPLKILADNVLGGKPLPAEATPVVAVLPGVGSSDGLLFWVIAATVVLFVVGWLVGLADTFATIGFSQRMAYDLASDVFAHLQRLSLRFHLRKPVGDSIRRVTTDSAGVSGIVKDAVLPLVASLIGLVSVFAVMWQMDRALTLMSLAVVPLLFITLKLYARPMEERSYEQQQVEGEMYNVVEQTLSAIPLVKAFGGEERADLRMTETTSRVLDATLATTKVQLQFKVLAGLATALGTAGIIWLGAQHALDGQLTIGTILVFISYLGSLYSPLESLTYTSSTVQGAAGSVRRVLEVLDTEPEVRDRPRAERLRRVRGQIVFDKVSFGYEEDGSPVLRDIDLEIKPGESVAIVGQTGAGKTTLAGLVPRFFDPLAGRVLVDGHDVRDVQLRSLREQIALVLQEPFLFPITIAENIAYGKPNATQAEIERAARAANAHAFIEKLPERYDTVVGERGATLSGGEKQRIAIARAMLKDASILILDEPTSSLDSQTEREVLEAIERLARGKTTIMIAHRLSTIRGADRIVVLRDGAIVERGTHDQLLSLGGHYARAYEAQFGDEDA